jgi:hypothetical protein
MKYPEPEFQRIVMATRPDVIIVRYSAPCCGQELVKSATTEYGEQNATDALTKWLDAAKAGHKCAVHS